MDTDLGVLWASHQAGGFPNIHQDADQEEFADLIIDWLSLFSSVFVVEDKTKAFRVGRGAIGMISVLGDGEVIKPFPLVFPWATSKNILRGVVSFFQFVKYSKDVTMCAVYGTKEEHNILLRQRKYGHNLWHIGNGIWCITGRKKNPRR